MEGLLANAVVPDQSGNSRPKYNVDLAVKRVGGFGRYQLLMTILMALFRNAGMSIVYGVPTFTTQQKYFCSTVEGVSPKVICERELICERLEQGLYVDYEVDKSDIGYIYGWEEEMNLLCVDPTQVSAMTSLYFVGFGVGIILFPMPDMYGRRPSLLISMFGYLVSIVTLLQFPSMTMRSIALFGIGFFHLKNSASFVYCFELVQDDRKSAVSTAINAFDGATLVFLGTYFIYVDDWYYYQFVMFVIQAIAFVIFLALGSESPKWLLLQGRRTEAIEVFNTICLINGKASNCLIESDAIFSECYADLSENVTLQRQLTRKEIDAST
jgi:MFS family permease